MRGIHLDASLSLSRSSASDSISSHSSAGALCRSLFCRFSLTRVSSAVRVLRAYRCMHRPMHLLFARASRARSRALRAYLSSLTRSPPRVRMRVLMCFNVYSSRRYVTYNDARSEAYRSIFLLLIHIPRLSHVPLPRLDHVKSVTVDISYKS